MTRTSIPCQSDTKEQLERLKRESETWDDTLRRLSDVAEESTSQGHAQSPSPENGGSLGNGAVTEIENNTNSENGGSLGNGAVTEIENNTNSENSGSLGDGAVAEIKNSIDQMQSTIRELEVDLTDPQTTGGKQEVQIPGLEEQIRMAVQDGIRNSLSDRS